MKLLEVEKEQSSEVLEESLIIVDEKQNFNVLNSRKIILFVFTLLAVISIFLYIFVKPKVSYRGARVEVIEFGQKYLDQGLNVKIGKKDISKEIQVEGNVDINKIGIYKIKYKVPYLDEYIEYKRIVKVIDSKKPELSINVKEKVYVNEEYNRNDYKAIDNVDGDISDKVEISGNVDTSKDGAYQLTYKIKDSSGNEKEENKTILVENYIGTICLTFDDGPSSNITPKVLDILKEKNIKATFFVLNFSDDKNGIIKREVEEGNSLGLHGYLHAYNEVYKSEQSAVDNFIRIQARVKEVTGVNSTLIRFPGGSSNTVSEKYEKGLMSRLTQRMIKEGFRYFDWNVSAEDAGLAHSSDDVYNFTMKEIKPGRTNVVLMHDFASNQKMIDVLPRIINDAINQGYKFEAITDKTDSVIHNVQN